MNLKGGPSNTDSGAVTKDYDFGVVYSTKRVEGEEGAQKDGEGKRTDNQEHRRQRKQRDHGTEFGKEKKNESDDDDFQIVRDQKTRVKKTRQADSDSDEEDESRGRGGFRGARVQRGGERGRGGFIKNSAKRTE